MYIKTNWIDKVTPVNAQSLNRLEDAMYGLDVNLNNVILYTQVNAASDVFNLDMNTGINFMVDITSTSDKTITFSNVPSTANLIINATVLVKATNIAAMTYPANTKWQDGMEPVLNTGKQYLLLFTSYDNGNTWLASFVGEW